MRMLSDEKKQVLGLSLILAATVVTSVYLTRPSGYNVDLIARILYGISVGFSLTLGCRVITTLLTERKDAAASPIENFTLLVISISCFILLDVVVVNLLWVKVILKGSSFTNSLSDNILIASILVEFIVGLTGYLIILSRNFSMQMKEYYTEIGEIKNELSKYKYETLKNQLNPHFLFNMLNTLSGLIHKDLDKSDTFIYHFSLLYRYALRVEPEDVVPLSQELEFIEHFLFLNNIRFNDAISSQIHITDQAQFIVPMALQLAFENAIKHNQFNKNNPLTIQVEDKEGYLVITNNKSKKTNPDPSSNIGIPILQARYARLCSMAIKIEDQEDKFSLFLPILKDAD